MSLTVENAYDNIEKILTQGFLTAGVFFDGSYFLLKNITEKEYNNLSFYRYEKDTSSNILYQLAFCTAFINGVNFLSDRVLILNDLVGFYNKLPVVFSIKIRDIIQKLNSEYLESIDYLEGFCYTDKSRYLWNVMGNRSKDFYYGVSGLDRLGVNTVQENWTIINKRLDEEEIYNRDLNLALLVASATNPKGTKVLSKNYEFHKKEIDELRKEIAKYGHDKKRVKEQAEKAEWTAPLNSKEDLVRELYRQMSGKKDKHDLFIEHWIKEQRNKAESAKQQAEARQQEYRAKLQEVDLSEIEGSRPVTVEELNKIISHKKMSKDGVSASSYMSSFEDVGYRDRFIKKISATVIRPKA